MEKVENILHHHKKDDGQTEEQVQEQSSTMTGQGETETKSKGLFGLGVGNPFPHVCFGSLSTQIDSPGTCRGRSLLGCCDLHVEREREMLHSRHLMD